MSRRVTVVMADDNYKKLRSLQSKLIGKTQGSYSFSKVLNEIIKKGLK